MVIGKLSSMNGFVLTAQMLSSWTNSLNIGSSSWVNGFVLRRFVLDEFLERSEFVPDE
jgi:hypothetical protein